MNINRVRFDFWFRFKSQRGFRVHNHEIWLIDQADRRQMFRFLGVTFERLS